MIQEIYQKAIRFAGEKHSEQKVPASKANYLLHVSNVAMEILVAYQQERNFNLKLAVQLALLHDTLENTKTSYKELEQIFGENVAQGVEALTKTKEILGKTERMLDSLSRINQLGKEVGMVKLADRITNLQAPPSNWKKDKIYTYYEEAKIIAEHLQNKNPYLEQRLKTKIKEYKRYIL